MSPASPRGINLQETEFTLMHTRIRMSGIPALSTVLVVLSACGDGSADLDDMSASELLDASANRMEAVTSFAFALEHENGFTDIIRGLAMETAEGEVAGPDRMAAELRARVGPINVALGLIIHPEGAWISNPLTGQWEPEDVSIAQLFDPATGVTSLMRDLGEVRVTGTEVIDGRPTRRIEGVVDSGALAALLPGVASGREVTARFWIGSEDPVVHRIDLLGAVGPDDSPDIVRRLRLSRFGQEFLIEPPR